MKNIYIVRHGESQGNARAIGKDEYVIDSSIELTLKGIQQAKDAGYFLRPYLNNKKVAFWVSPFKRTRKTADYMIKKLEDTVSSVEYIEDPRLVEQDFGDFDFQFYADWEKISPHSFFINQARYNDETGRFFARLPNGENVLDVYNRMSLFVKTRLESAKHKENVIVTHGVASRALAMFLLDLPIEEYYTTDIPGNCSIRHIVYKNGKYIDKGYIHS